MSSCLALNTSISLNENWYRTSSFAGNRGFGCSLLHAALTFHLFCWTAVIGRPVNFATSSSENFANNSNSFGFHQTYRG